ncbi:hypothetical protein WH87_04895 [Devosia epidermidihirudinis]|uniref:DUF1376 domain-containing protein n=1 Tax=Devosia epidermidihirudinis TaxID=1293439 RepID=A0A0F5QEY3_9HYPH|nr:hypothetical protein [Devosia epidermidihirudinis]KKC39532.1 hypothetical protein WH87_04895 [Devosia epidermidihirudinis]
MSRWFRHYAGMMRDEKLVSVAVKAKQPVERVVWVWGAILESASEINDNGRYEFDAGEAAYFLRCDDADLVGILACLESLGRLSNGVVVRWSDRQYSSDSAAERQRRYRERKSANAAVSPDDRDNQRDSDVTRPSRDADVTAQETDTYLETDRKKAPPNPQGGEAGDLFDQVEAAMPRSPTYNQAKAERAWRRLSPADQQALHSKALAFGVWWTAEQAKRNRSMSDSLRFAPPLDKWIGEGAWRSFDASAAANPAVSLPVLRDGDPLIPFIEKLRGKPIYFGTKGTTTVTPAELEKAQAALGEHAA